MSDALTQAQSEIAFLRALVEHLVSRPGPPPLPATVAGPVVVPILEPPSEIDLVVEEYASAAPNPGAARQALNLHVARCTAQGMKSDEIIASIHRGGERTESDE